MSFQTWITLLLPLNTKEDISKNIGNQTTLIFIGISQNIFFSVLWKKVIQVWSTQMMTEQSFLLVHNILFVVLPALYSYLYCNRQSVYVSSKASAEQYQHHINNITLINSDEITLFWDESLLKESTAQLW